MAKKISLANQKGGVGKSTSCINIGSLLATMGYRVCLVDIDAQSSTTHGTTNLVKIIEDDIPTMNEVMLGETHIKDIIIPLKEYSENLFLAPATLELSDAELTIVNSTMRETILQRELTSIDDDYDFILIDCPPARGLLTINALSASDFVLIPLQADYLAYVGVNLLYNTIMNVKEYINPKLQILGYFLTMKERTLHANDVKEQSKKDFEQLGLNLLGSISRATAVKDAILAGMDIYNYDPKNKVALQYKDLTLQILKQLSIKEGGGN